MMIRFRQPRVIVGLAVLVVFLFGVLVGIGGAQTPTPVPTVPDHEVKIRLVDDKDMQPLPSIGKWEGRVNIQGYDYYGNAVTVAYTECTLAGPQVMCVDSMGYVTVKLPAGRYDVEAYASQHRMARATFSVPAQFIELRLEPSPLDQNARVTLSIEGRDIKGTIEVLKREAVKYDSRIELRLFGPGRGLGWSTFMPKFVEQDLGDTLKFSFEVPVPVGGFLPGRWIVAEARVMLKDDNFTQDAQGYAFVQTR